MKFSFWEHNTWFEGIDLAVIGAGIVGLSTALNYKQKNPDKKVVIFEKGSLPQGASTKNAGFACFGSMSEILDDLKSYSDQELKTLVERRWKGLELLRSTLGDQAIDYKNLGGYEIFEEKDEEVLNHCLREIPYVNRLLYPIFGQNVFSVKREKFNFGKVLPTVIFNSFEGQIDTGRTMKALIEKCKELGVEVFYGMKALDYEAHKSKVSVSFQGDNSIECCELAICTNGFASELLKEDVVPARAQVLITEPIENLEIKGTFHMDEGYYYFRNFENRILLGGGRNLDKEGEETLEFGQSKIIQSRLEEILYTIILKDYDKKKIKIDKRWSGIMGVGQIKTPIVKALSNRVYIGVRLGGMGVALGSGIGKELSDLIIQGSTESNPN
jgi:glycine/D-amino acid oxidase-like deaminating enzyme